jgi:hypothetical protein
MVDAGLAAREGQFARMEAEPAAGAADDRVDLQEPPTTDRGSLITARI